MKNVRTWLASFIPATILCCFGFSWAESFHRDAHSGSISNRLVVALLVVGPIFAVSHAAAYTALLGRVKKWITVLSAALIGPAISTLSVYLILK